VNYLKGKGPEFVLGYCFGGAMTWQAAGRIKGIASSSSYYGGYMANPTPKCPNICTTLSRRGASASPTSSSFE
jgi:carboxymethylenebutenolidase